MKINSLNGIRGLAVLLVFTAHTPIRQIIGEFGQPAVYMFFFLSAFLLTIPLVKNSYSIKTYIKKRLFRIYPLYLFLIIVLGILGSYSVLTIFQNLLFLQNLPSIETIISVSWSLVIEMQFYILLPFLIMFLFKDKRINYKRAIFLISITYVFRFMHMDWYYQNFLDGSFRIVYGNFIEVMDIFIFGMILVSKYLNDEIRQYQAYEILGLLVVFLTMPFILSLSDINMATQIIWIVIPLYSFLIYHLFGAAITNKGWYEKILSNPIFVFYGMISYSFYLLHIPILGLFNNLNYTTVAQMALVGVVSFVIITLISFLTYTFIEKKFIV